MRVIPLAVAILALAAAPALASPCNTTGSVKGKTPEQQAGNTKSSAADGSSQNLAGGQQPASPGTVGAMNNAGANQGLGDKEANNSSSKNLAGGNQPSSPATVGAMNNAGKDQKVGTGDDC